MRTFLCFELTSVTSHVDGSKLTRMVADLLNDWQFIFGLVQL
jgi:hypothetical protein